MSPQRSNVEAVKAAFEAFNRRDPEAFIREGRLRSDYEWQPFMAAGVEAGVYRGHDGVREWFSTVDEMFETFSAELLSVRDTGECVVVLGTLRARGRGSGVPVESPLGIVVEIDAQGLARRATAFTTHADALAHAGLAPEGGTQ
jgi:ketosteroid isomerase-like protein